MSKYVSLRLSLLKESADSFLDALDEKGVPHGRVEEFSFESRASGIKESIFTLAEVMPWKAISEVMVAWVKERGSREIIITTEDRQVVHIKGYSSADAEKLLKIALEVTVIDAGLE